MSHTIHKTMDLSIFKTLIVRLYLLDATWKPQPSMAVWKGLMSSLPGAQSANQRSYMRAGHIEITKALIAAGAGAHLNAKNCFNFTALMFAALLNADCLWRQR